MTSSSDRKFRLQLSTRTSYDPLTSSKRRRPSRAVDTAELGLSRLNATPADKRFRSMVRRSKDNSSSSSSSSTARKRVRRRNDHMVEVDRDDITLVPSSADVVDDEAGVRAASTKLLARVLLQPSVAAEIEEACYAMGGTDDDGATDDAYRAHVRGLVTNLRSNGELLESVRRGDTRPAALALMSTDELASTELQRERAEAREESEVRAVHGAESTDYACPSCAAQKCVFWVQSIRRDIGKSETWGSKDAAHELTIRLECSMCSHQWVRHTF